MRSEHAYCEHGAFCANTPIVELRAVVRYLTARGKSGVGINRLSDFWAFPMLKRHLGGECYRTDNKAQCAVNSFFRKQPTEFYAAGISHLVSRYSKCLERGGDYVEK